MELSCPLQKWTAVLPEDIKKTRCVICTRLWHCDPDGKCAICINKQQLGAKSVQLAPYPQIKHDLKRFAVTGPARKIEDNGDWFVAITAAPRKEPTLIQCVNSLRGCGWEPTIFAEPGSPATNAETITNPQRLGVWQNWLSSAFYAINNTSAKFVLTVQDDSLFHPETRAFTESILWPSPKAGFVSLYTAKHYSENRKPGVNRVNTRSLWGACALVWHREVLARVIRHETATTWLGVPPRSNRREVMQRRKDDPSTIANSDTAIGTILNQMGLEMYFVDPSPVTHIARHSTINHGGNNGRRNCSRCADHALSLFDQVRIAR